MLRTQIAAIRGQLNKRSPLGAVALQFGQSMGKPDGLRNALGRTDETGRWEPRRPDPKLYQTQTECHARGDILVGAMFEAFQKIYESRIADLRNLASHGTGQLPDGNLHPDLINRFTYEAARSASQVLDMCIRALDYLPPVDFTFGDFLRAMITADYDLDPIDTRHYRVALVEAFRGYGICPQDVGTVSTHTLRWPAPQTVEQAQALAPFICDLARKHAYWSLPTDRKELWYLLEEKKIKLKTYLTTASDLPQQLGEIDLSKPFEVQSFHPRERTGVAGNLSSQWIIKLVQTLPGRRTPKKSVSRQVGTTLLVDADSGQVRYLISKQPRAQKTTRKTLVATPSILPVGKAIVARPPHERRLRVFAFDPTMGIKLETAGINEVTLRIPWERDRAGNDILRPGPVGEYLEVVDRDPASRAYYSPVDLNNPYLLAQDGLAPSESTPQFHQQMVYAVAMRTIQTFERALGRLALWSSRPFREAAFPGDADREEEYVQRLRIYPHALREPNAYYSPVKKAILFGYFPDSGTGGGAGVAPLTVFTCLSHDIIAHEMTHALLDGMHSRFGEPSNPDVLAFHEAFADIVALFQHFSLPEVLRHQVAATRGDLESQNSLGELAQQFGQATGNRGALRSALGGIDENGKWVRAKANPNAYRQLKEPHARGTILVAAVFDAFLTIYKTQIADLLRIASDGTGILPAGHLHPDLVNRLADEAAQSAGQVLYMCVRALDYCPPVDLTFGDYLRAIITADFEFDPVDEQHRRVAFVEAFRSHGIVPENVRTLSVDGLLWHSSAAAPDEDEDAILQLVRDWAPDIADWNLTKNREDLFNLMKKKRAALHEYLKNFMKKRDSITGGIDPKKAPFEVHSIRPSFRTDWEGRARFQWIIELTQRLPEFVDQDDLPQEQRVADYYFRGGSTLVVDAETGKVRYSIKKRMDDKTRQDRQRRFLTDEGNERLAATYFGGVDQENNEPFALLHRH